MLPKMWPAVLALGWILLVTAGGEALMALVGLADRDGGAFVFAISAAVTAAIAGACILTTKGRPFELRFRDAALLTSVSWFVVPAFAALPLMGHPIGLSFVDAYFEMVSGFTTTGSTVMVGLDAMPASILLWRSTVQWLGGLGIIGLAMIILPFLRIGGMQLFRPGIVRPLRGHHAQGRPRRRFGRPGLCPADDRLHPNLFRHSACPPSTRSITR